MLGPTPLNTGVFVAVDIETTGCRPGTSSVIEIGAVRVESGSVTGQFNRLVSPTDDIPAAITRLTGITADMLAGAPTIAEVIADFRAFVGDAVLVAHNHRFDMSFLDYEAERAWGAPFARPILDTLTLARRLRPDIPRHNLRDLAALYETTDVPNHRALPDALATAEVFLRMIPELEAAGIVTAADAARLCGIAQQSRLARKLSLATNLPDGPGVYTFRDDRGRVVFVGRAKSLRTRVRNHFYAPDDTTSPSPASEVAAISHFSMVSPLDAALLEVRLQDRYAPTFNRNGHRQRPPLYLHVDTGSEFPSLRPTRRRLKSGQLLGPMANEWATETVADALSQHFGLRRCRCSVQECQERECEHRDDESCLAPDAYESGKEAYASGVRAALSVFDGGGPAFRELLRTMQEQSARAERFEDAAHYRDAIRALDRTLGALAVAHRASSEILSVIIEGDSTSGVALVLVRGWRFTTVRFNRELVDSGTLRDRIEIALTRARQAAGRNTAVTARRLRDMAIIDAYRQQHTPLVVPVDEGDVAAAAERVAASVRRMMRVPRKRHGVA
ncbi:MAG: exonuclease domain-containing protein [Coriobacteriia bacterium]|nr:exonuclease domain-containing protein [Coriobacteriia bacterium]